jgi:hypothetical protein
VVPQDDVRVAAEAGENGAQAALAASAGDEVSGDADEVGFPLDDPVDRAVDRAEPARRDAEVEVREVRDAQPVELGRQPRNEQLADAEADPAGFEGPVGEPGSGDAERDPEKNQTWSFSTTGLTETT